jgi:hypothetical protein
VAHGLQVGWGVESGDSLPVAGAQRGKGESKSARFLVHRVWRETRALARARQVAGARTTPTSTIVIKRRTLHIIWCICALPSRSRVPQIGELPQIWEFPQRYCPLALGGFPKFAAMECPKSGPQVPQLCL